MDIQELRREAQTMQPQLTAGSSPPAPEPGGPGRFAGDGGLCQGAADGDGIPSAGAGRRPDRHRHRN